MARLFFSLYVFIVITLFGLAFVLKSFFSDPEQSESVWVDANAQVLQSLANHPAELEQLLSQLKLEHQWLAADTVAWPSDQNNDTPLIVYGSSGTAEIILTVPQRGLLQISGPIPDENNVWMIWSIFFILFGLMLSLWIWPLWRDLTKLKKASASLRKDGSLPAIKVSSASALSNIVSSFNLLGSQIKQLIQSQRELTGAVAHEFRTPLSRLKFALVAEPEAGSQAWCDMNRDVDELERLVQEMLDYSSMENIAPEMNYSNLPLCELIEQLVNRLKKNNSADINLIYPSNRFELMADGHFVERALQNIISNAQRYARNQIQVSLEQTEHQISILIDDDGTGVKLEDREKIFEPFFRPDSGRDRKRGGAGLGLAIVKRIQQWHGGDCYVQDSPLGGARFVLTYAKS